MKPKQTAMIVFRCLAIFLLLEAGVGMVSQLLFLLRIGVDGFLGSGTSQLFTFSGLLPVLCQVGGCLLLWLKADTLADMVLRYAPIRILDRYQELEDTLKK